MRERRRVVLSATAILSLLASALWAITVPAVASASPVTPTVTPSGSPALSMDSPDPDIVRVGTTFYVFTTGTTWGNQIAIAETTNANPEVGWAPVEPSNSSAFPQVNYHDPLAPWQSASSATSPGVYNFDGQWIMFYDAYDPSVGLYCLSVATASAVTGPYSDTSSGPFECQTSLGGSIDPQPFVDPATGDPYLIWKSNDGSSASASRVWSAPLSSNGITLAGAPTDIFTIASSPYPWQQTTDDPSMAYAGGNYYLFFSGGNYLSDYYPTGYVVCADGPNGGCDQNEASDPILNQPGGSGGGGVFSDASGNWYLSYQTWEPTSCTHYTGDCAREMFIAPVSLPQMPPPSITTSSLPPAGVNTPYSLTLSATSGTAPYYWTITSGSLPSNLTLNLFTGVISGTATATGTQDITFKVTDSDGESSTRSLSLSVKAGSVTAPTAEPTSIIYGASVDYSATVRPASGGGTPTGSVTFSVGSTNLCSASLSGGAGSCNTGATPVGVDTVTATYSGDSNFGLSIGTTNVVVKSGPYTPIAPIRVCDTRPGNPSNLDTSPADQCNGIYNSGTTIIPGGTMSISVAGAFGIPSDATSLVLNVTVVDPTSAGYVTVFPTGAAQPVASNINYVRGNVVPNLVQVGIGTSGDVSFYASTQTDVVVDAEGYTAATNPTGTGAGLYQPLASPVRICDTRAGNPSNLSGPDSQCNGAGNAGETLAAQSTLNVNVGGNNGIPANAIAAVLNVTVANPAAAGYLTVFPEGGTAPTASNVNYVGGQVTANRVIVPLSGSGNITVYSSSRADVIIDVSGYYTASGGSGAQFSAEPTPIRICDTRTTSPSNQCTGEPIGPGGTLMLSVTGLAGVPSDATAVAINLTGIFPSVPDFLTVFPNSLPSPLVSDLNEVPGEVSANLVVATLNPDNGTISIYNSGGDINVVVDVLGWYS